MSVFLKTLKTPKQADCLECIKKAGKILELRSWSDVKFWVYNSNNSRKKALKRMGKAQ